jgi:RNA polymerase sigma-70 factor, ECF subfamily
MHGMPSVASVEGMETAPAEECSRTETGEKLNESARSALGGDPFAVQQFLRAIVPLVRKICRGILGHESQELEDTIQDCLIDVVRALPQFRFEADVSHYITKIVMRRAIASRRRARARSKQYIEIDPRHLRLATSDDAEEARADLVRNLLDNLNEAQATVLLLRIMLGHTITEIACITGVPENTVRTRLRLGKKQLRQWLERRGEGSRARY